MEMTYKKRKTHLRVKTPVLLLSALIMSAGILLLVFCTDKIYSIEVEEVAVTTISYPHTRDEVVNVVAEAKEEAVIEIPTVSGPYTGSHKDTNLGKAYNILIEKGWSSVAACAALGNLCAETGDDPYIRDINPGAKGRLYSGIAQWDNSGRYSNMVKFCQEEGYDPESIEGQINFVNAEATDNKYGQSYRVSALKNPKSFAGGNSAAHTNLPDNFWETDNIDQATKAFALCYEGCVQTPSSAQYCDEGLQHLYKRQGFAKKCYEIFVEGKE